MCSLCSPIFGGPSAPSIPYLPFIDKPPQERSAGAKTPKNPTAPYGRLGLLASLLLLGHADPQVRVGCVEPPRLLLLLLLCVLPQRRRGHRLLLEDEGRHRGRDEHIAFGFAFLLHEGVAVGVTGAVALQSEVASGPVSSFLRVV